MVLIIELRVRFEAVKAVANNPSLEELEVPWWRALLSLLVFSGHDATGPASAKPCPSTMLAKVGTDVDNFDLEEHMASVIEFALWNVKKARAYFKKIEKKLSGEEAERSSPREDFQKALSLVRERLLITLVLFAFLSLFDPK